MRQIGTISEHGEAERFAAYLITQGIAVQAEQDGDAWTIWVRDEDRVEAAKDSLQHFCEDPQDPRYARVVDEANSLLQQEVQRREQARRNLMDIRRRWGSARPRSGPLTRAVLILCVAMFVLSGFGTARNSMVRRTLGFLNTARPFDERTSPWSDRLADIRDGQVWRLVTPIFLHHDPLHLVFNLLMFHVFASRIEERLGTARLGGLILLIALVSNLAQGLAPSNWDAFSGGPNFVGISGVVYGLFGYVWIKSLFEPELGMFVSGSTVAILLAWMFLGIFGLLDTALSSAATTGGSVRIANTAHVVGLLVGTTLAWLPQLRHTGRN
jgi:GlpG protein